MYFAIVMEILHGLNHWLTGMRAVSPAAEAKQSMYFGVMDCHALRARNDEKGGLAMTGKSSRNDDEKVSQ